LILVDFWGVNKTFCKKSITEGLLKLCVAYKAFFFKLLFFRSKGLRRGFAIDFGYKLVAFYLTLIILADKAFF
jgi:hypothetical protein